MIAVSLSVCQDDGQAHLPATDRAHSGNAVAALLDSSDSRLPAAAQFRAGVLLPVSCAVPVLQRLVAGFECADLLRRAAGGAYSVRQDAALRRIVFPSSAADSP